jgi:hypothetical protein
MSPVRSGSLLSNVSTANNSGTRRSVATWKGSEEEDAKFRYVQLCTKRVRQY